MTAQRPIRSRAFALLVAAAFLAAGLGHAWEECCGPAGGDGPGATAQVGQACCDHGEGGDPAVSALPSPRRAAPDAPSAWDAGPALPAVAALPCAPSHPSRHFPPTVPVRPCYLVLGCLLC